jgi:hypothetical protein
MPIDKRAPKTSWSIELKVETIANGYIVTARGNPSKDDPYGDKVGTSRKRAGPWYIRELEEATEMVQHIIELIQLDETTQEALGND